MKKIALAVGLASGLAANLVAGGTLRLKLEPDRDYVLSGAPREVVVKIDLTAIDHKTKSRRTPLNLAVVLDRSGSMTGAKIEKARQAAMGLVDQLAPGDVFSFITYSDHAEVVLPAQQVEDKEALKERISRVHPGGSTALYAGVQAGADQIQKHLSAHKINRVILLSDGLANIGPCRPQDLRRLGGTLSERGIAVTTIGVGDDYNEDLMAGLAEASDANYYYVKDTEKLPEIFAKELGELIHVAARNVRIEIICPNGVKPIGLIGRPERFEGQKTSVMLSQFTASQDRFLFLRCMLNEPKPDIAHVKVSYMDEVNGGNEDTVSETAKIQYTDDKLRAANSIRAGVVAEKELWLTAIAKDEALAAADAGRYQDAAQRLASQAKVLDQQYANAPKQVQPQLRQEAENLRQRSEELRQNQYDARSRKIMQSESWTTRNSKTQN
jgi:Ca-activated chloride channel family protein